MTVEIAIFRAGLVLAVSVVQLSQRRNRFARAIGAIARNVREAADDLDLAAEVLSRGHDDEHVGTA